MNNIKWIFNPRFLEVISVPFIICLSVFTLILILTTIFVIKELKSDKKKGDKNEK